jgi:hypothetical protein
VVTAQQVYTEPDDDSVRDCPNTIMLVKTRSPQTHGPTDASYRLYWLVATASIEGMCTGQLKNAQVKGRMLDHVPGDFLIPGSIPASEERFWIPSWKRILFVITVAASPRVAELTAVKARRGFLQLKNVSSIAWADRSSARAVQAGLPPRHF